LGDHRGWIHSSGESDAHWSEWQPLYQLREADSWKHYRAKRLWKKNQLTLPYFFHRFISVEIVRATLDCRKKTVEVTKRFWSKNVQNMKLPWKIWVTFLFFFFFSIRIFWFTFFPCVSTFADKWAIHDYCFVSPLRLQYADVTWGQIQYSCCSVGKHLGRIIMSQNTNMSRVADALVRRVQLPAHTNLNTCESKFASAW